jgi:hypothetical protein
MVGRQWHLAIEIEEIFKKLVATLLVFAIIPYYV